MVTCLTIPSIHGSSFNRNFSNSAYVWHVLDSLVHMDACPLLNHILEENLEVSPKDKPMCWKSVKFPQESLTCWRCVEIPMELWQRLHVWVTRWQSFVQNYMSTTNHRKHFLDDPKSLPIKVPMQPHLWSFKAIMQHISNISSHISKLIQFLLSIFTRHLFSSEFRSPKQTSPPWSIPFFYDHIFTFLCPMRKHARFKQTSGPYSPLNGS